MYRPILHARASIGEFCAMALFDIIISKRRSLARRFELLRLLRGHKIRVFTSFKLTATEFCGRMSSLKGSLLHALSQKFWYRDNNTRRSRIVLFFFFHV